jgi:inosine-uridine nucleoside N-ribohydrolase
VRVHLDTDLGGDIDDLCALAMLLGWPDAELTGITTVAEEVGRRAGYVHRALELGGRRDIPVAAGVDVASGRYRDALEYPSDEEYWGGPVPPRPGPLAAALELLRRSIDLGAVIVAVGPYSNLAELEASRPGTLARARIVLMGGTIFPPRDGFPAWGPDVDYNVQVDVGATETVLGSATPTLVTVAACLEATLRRAHLPTLRQSGPLGQLLARQAEAFARDVRYEERLGGTYAGIPADTINFLYDPLAVAIALGWRQGVQIDPLPLAWERRDGVLHLRVAADGRRMPVVRAVDGPHFSAEWLRRVRH